MTQRVSRTRHRRHMHAGRAMASLRVRLSLVRSGEAIPGPNPGIEHEQSRLLVHGLCMNLVAERMLAVQPDHQNDILLLLLWAAMTRDASLRIAEWLHGWLADAHTPTRTRILGGSQDGSNFEMAASAGRVTFPPSLFLSRKALLLVIKELPARASPSSPSSIFWRSYASKGADNGLTQSSNTSGAPMPWTTKRQGHDRVTISPCRAGPLTGAAPIQEASLVTTTSLHTSTMIVHCLWHLFPFRAHSPPLRCPRQRSATLRQPGRGRGRGGTRRRGRASLPSVSPTLLHDCPRLHPSIITTNIRGLVYINNLSHLTSVQRTGVRHECGKNSKPLLPDVVPAHINQKLATFKGLCILCFDQKVPDVADTLGGRASARLHVGALQQHPTASWSESRTKTSAHTHTCGTDGLDTMHSGARSSPRQPHFQADVDSILCPGGVNGQAHGICSLQLCLKVPSYTERFLCSAAGLSTERKRGRG